MPNLLSRIGARLKPLERANRHFWFHVLGAVWRNRPLEGPLPPGGVRRVLFLRYDAIGDMLTTMPVFALLKARVPGIAVDVIASPRNRMLIEGDPNVDAIIEMGDGFAALVHAVRAARRRRYDAVICCIFGRGTKVGIIANLIGGRRAVKATIWRSEPYWSYFNVQSRSAARLQPMWERMLYLLTDTLAINATPADIVPYVVRDPAREAAAVERLAACDLEPGGFLLVNISVSHERNRWGWENFEALLRGVQERFPTLRLGLLSMPAERAAAEGLCAAPGVVAVVLPSMSDVRDVIAVVARAVAVFTPDTGVVHMASATGRPAVTMHAGATSAAEWGPYGVLSRVLVSERTDTIATIPAADAIAAVIELLEEVGVERAA